MKFYVFWYVFRLINFILFKAKTILKISVACKLLIFAMFLTNFRHSSIYMSYISSISPPLHVIVALIANYTVFCDVCIYNEPNFEPPGTAIQTTWHGEKLYVFAGLVEKYLGEKIKYVCNSRKKQMLRNLIRKRKLIYISNRFEIVDIGQWIGQQDHKSLVVTTRPF